MQTIGIYGGTFDPIHRGHLHVINHVLTHELVDYLLVIPSGEPWLREHQPLAGGADRVAMCALAISELPQDIKNRIDVSPLEIDRSGPSYMIDTVEAVQANHPGSQLILILGSDAAEHLHRWHRAGELQELVDVLIVERPDQVPGKGIDIQALPISATQVRAEIVALANSSAIPPIVATYIKEHGLYGSK